MLTLETFTPSLSGEQQAIDFSPIPPAPETADTVPVTPKAEGIRLIVSVPEGVSCPLREVALTYDGITPLPNILAARYGEPVAKALVETPENRLAPEVFGGEPIVFPEGTVLIVRDMCVEVDPRLQATTEQPTRRPEAVKSWFNGTEAGLTMLGALAVFGMGYLLRVVTSREHEYHHG